MSGIKELFWRPLPDVRPNERSRFLFFAGLATLITLAQTLGLVGAEALFMARYGARLLPATIIGGSIATVVSSIAYAARVGNARNDTLFIQMLIGSGVLLALSTGLLLYDFAWVSGFLICFYFVAQAILVNHLWTFTADYFDTVSSKRLIPMFTIGFSIGGVLGGSIGIGISQTVGSVWLIGGWGMFLLLGATLLRVRRSSLRGWGPIEIDEADETSVEGIQGAIRYVRASTLGRSLVVSAVGMTLALVVARYMWLDVFARRFPDPDELGAFLSLYQTGTNLIEIAIEMALVPLLIRRFGVPTANLVHPTLTILSFAGLAYSFNVITGALARMNGEMLENAVANPIRALLCNAIPLRFRGRVRAFLEGIVGYASMSIGGAALVWFTNPDPLHLAIGGGAAGVTYLLANLLVRREYVRTLIAQLRTGRLDLNDLGEEIGDFEAARLADLWEQLLANEGERPSSSLLKMIPNLATRGIVEPLRRACTHASPDVRRSCLTELARVNAEGVEATLTQALDDPQAAVRLAAIRGLLRLGEHALSPHTNRRLMNDPDPLIRAEAALRAGPDGLATIEKMIASDDVGEAVAALTTAPVSMLGAASQRVHDPEPAVGAAALEFIARSGSDEVTIDVAREALGHADSRVRRAAVLLLANLDGEDALASLAGAIRDPAGEVQFAAETVLRSLGDDGIDAVADELSGELERGIESALRVVARAGSERVDAILTTQLRRRVDTLWFWMIAFQRVPINDSVASRFLHAAYSDAISRSRRICFRILEHLESPRIVRNVEKALRFGSPRARGDALEVLSHLGDRVAAQHLVTLHESGPLSERIEVVSRSISVPRDPEQLIEASLASRAAWIRLGAAAYRASESHPEEETMERLLALKQISLFNGLSLDQLEAVHQITREVEYLEGEVIMREGERDDQLYLLLEGRVLVYKNHGTSNPTLLNELDAVTYIGEMAVLDGEPRSATIVASTHCRLLSLDGNSLRELLLQMPEISFEIFRVLATRVRVAESRIGS